VRPLRGSLEFRRLLVGSLVFLIGGRVTEFAVALQAVPLISPVSVTARKVLIQWAFGTDCGLCAGRRRIRRTASATLVIDVCHTRRGAAAASAATTRNGRPDRTTVRGNGREWVMDEFMRSPPPPGPF
jgi:hypothetical protein